jgi:16S rRNA (guanine527-N7)-methyltransferase
VLIDKNVIHILSEKYGFDEIDIKNLALYVEMLISANKSRNFIGSSTLKDVWTRHILDSAQLVKLIDFEKPCILSDLGSGAGLPGIVLSIFNKNKKFHVKLYEKSAVKCQFLRYVIKKLKLAAEVIDGDIFSKKIDSGYIVARAFKKIDKMIQVSREIAKKPNKMIILKGKSAQEEINKVSKFTHIKYSLVNSVTRSDSKIIIVES